MPTFELEESEFAGYIEDGKIMPATVQSVKVADKPFKDDDGNTVKKVEFKFSIIDQETGQFDGTNVWGETGTKFNTHPDCKLRNWAQGIMGQELPVGYKLDTDVLVGRECRVYIELYEYEDKKGPKDPTTGKGEMKQRNRVIDVMPSSAAMASMSGGTGYQDEPF